MPASETVVTYAGGAVSLAGLAFAAAFVSYRTADPLAESVLGPLTLAGQVLGVVVGLVLTLVGLALAVRLGGEQRVG